MTDRWLLDGITHPIRPDLVPIYQASRMLDKWAVIQALDEHRQRSGEPEQIAYADQRDALDYMDDGSELMQRE